jgi:hypothetical protein
MLVHTSDNSRLFALPTRAVSVLQRVQGDALRLDVDAIVTPVPSMC